MTPFVSAVQDVLFTAYLEAYGRIRERYGWTDPPVIYQAGNTRYIDEPAPPRHLDSERYSAYFEDVMALSNTYSTALRLAGELGKKRLPRVDGYDGDVRELILHNLQLHMETLRGAA